MAEPCTYHVKVQSLNTPPPIFIGVTTCLKANRWTPRTNPALAIIRLPKHLSLFLIQCKVEYMLLLLVCNGSTNLDLLGVALPGLLLGLYVNQVLLAPQTIQRASLGSMV